MGILAAGQVVILPFPYSDLINRKLRPALLLAASGPEDWIACQITSNPFADQFAMELQPACFIAGGLRYVSYLRPSKLFTVHYSLVTSYAGALAGPVLEEARQAVTAAIRRS